MYIIIDDQNPDRKFADGKTFKSLEEIRQQLISYHSTDWGEDLNDLTTMPLEELLEYGSWHIETTDGYRLINIQTL